MNAGASGRGGRTWRPPAPASPTARCKPGRLLKVALLSWTNSPDFIYIQSIFPDNVSRPNPTGLQGKGVFFIRCSLQGLASDPGTWECGKGMMSGRTYHIKKKKKKTTPKRIAWGVRINP